jgi:nucleotide-binding universal stress UspA family protein
METIGASTETVATSEVGTGGPILAATDGMEQSEGALAVARALAGALGSTVQIVTVQRPLALVVPDASLLLEPDVTMRLATEQRDRARLQCAEISGESIGAALPEPELVSGEPERAITRIATEKGAQLIVVGIGRHDVIDRIFGSETALKVARLSRVPVLAVPAAFRGALHRAVVGLDFSDASLHAAQSALHLLAAGDVIDLVHVIPHGRLLLDPWISDREYDEFVRHQFARFRARLAIPPNVTVEQHTCSGDAAKELIAYAERQHADLIAAGSHGHGFVSRIVLGSVTTALLRAAKSAVLVVPPDSMSLGVASLIDGSGTVHLEPSQWATVLADFTRTNAGRRTRLEIDDPEIGAQAQEMDYPLRGVAFDPHDQRLEIMLGVLGKGEPHLSRSIGDVTSLDLLVDKGGQDVALRVRHGTGQTMLPFASS